MGWVKYRAGLIHRHGFLQGVRVGYLPPVCRG